MPREFAPGIPDKEVFKPVREVGKEGPNEVWALSLSRHDARKAGKHYDLRLTDPETGDAHSWALPRASWPEPGQKVLAVPQPTHTAEYAAREGEWEISEGYGAGTVKSKMLEPAEVVEASPRKITFNLYGPGQRIGQYSIIRTGNGGDLLVNHSPVGRQVTGTGGYAIPSSKMKYRETSFDNIDVSSDDVMQAKIDGANVVVGLQAGKPARVFSYRESAKQPVIEHTHRIPDWNQRQVPPGLGGTVIRAELWGERGGRAIPAQELGGLLNTDVWKSRLQQEARGIQLKLSPFDVEKYRGRDASGMTWEEKRNVLQQAADSLGWLHMPPTAVTPDEKKKLISEIESGWLPETSEGVVLFPKEGPPIKAKITPEYDGTITGTFEGRGKYEGRGIGGFLVKDESTGVTNRVGGGLSDKLRRAAYEEPGLFKGLIAKIKSRGRFLGGKMRDPRFMEFHLDKNDPDKLEQVMKLAFFDELEKIGALWGYGGGWRVTGADPKGFMTGLAHGIPLEEASALRYTDPVAEGGRVAHRKWLDTRSMPTSAPTQAAALPQMNIPRGHSAPFIGGGQVGTPVPTKVTGLGGAEAATQAVRARAAEATRATGLHAAAQRTPTLRAAASNAKVPSLFGAGAKGGRMRTLLGAVRKVAALETLVDDVIRGVGSTMEDPISTTVLLKALVPVIGKPEPKMKEKRWL